MEKYVIFLNGEYSEDNEYIMKLCKDRYIISADGGTNKLYELNIDPKIIVGDLDSVRPEVLEYYNKKNIKIISTIREKDYTDFEIAIWSIINKIPSMTGRFDNISKEEYITCHFPEELLTKDVLVLGATGGRVDMTISNMRKLHFFKNMKFITQNKEIITYHKFNNNAVNIIPKNIKKDNIFSIIPITSLQGLTLKGLKYPLLNANVSKDVGLVSNEIVGDVSIACISGEIYIIREDDE